MFPGSPSYDVRGEMDLGISTPLLNYFRRGDVPHDVRMMAARGAVAPRALEQLALLMFLSTDSDPEVARAADATIEAIDRAALEAFLARSDVPGDIKAFFARRNVRPAAVEAIDTSAPLIDTAPAGGEEAASSATAAPKPLALRTVAERVRIAMRGTREQRSQLIRDPAKLVAIAVLSSPKLTDTEVESFSRMANVSEEVLRVIGTNRGWVKNYGVASALARNPKTPLAISLSLVSRLTQRDVKLMAVDRNLPEAVRLAARKVLLTLQSRQK
ncbi:MAG: hypothetical protein HYX76_06520 [Acidobacteria bacterium]|nr:hypothetical protein [Acidobacteriota bacterium]